MQRPRFSQFFLSALLIFFAVAQMYAQGTSGVLTGTVADSSSAVIPGAAVTISNPVSGYSQTTRTDAQGQYRFANLPFGRYHVAVTSTGFRSATGDAQLRSASSMTLDFKLSVTGGEEVVNVESEPEDMVNADPTSGNAVDRILFARLPTESTNAPLSSLVSGSTPGIAGDSNGLFHPMGEHSDTSFSIDGQPVSDQQSRVFGNQLSVNAIQSINVINGIAPPEYGDKASLVVQTTTRSGLNLPHPTGSFSYSYGNFGASVGSLALGVGGKRFGNFLTADGVKSSRYLDTPEFKVIHAKGNNENFFDRVDFNPSEKNLTQLNMTASRSWFQNPNQYDQAAAGQDQRAQIFSYNLSPSWTHVLSDHSLFTVNPYLRQDNFHYYPSKNPFSDTPATLAQSRRLQNTGIKVDYSYSHGLNTVKVGGMLYHTFLHEGFSLGITDPNYNVPGTANYNPGAAAFDLTRGGSLYHFNGKTDIKQEAIYLQDTLAFKGFTFLLGGRIDNYNGLSRRSLVQPRLGASYLVKGTNTVLRAGYGKLFLTPYNENLIVSSSTGVGGLVGAGFPTPLKPAARNQYDAGFEQGFGKHLVVNGEYFWKYTDRDFDFDIVLNTPLAFPIQWKKSKIDGFGVKLTVPETHGISAYAVLGHTRSRFFSPEVGGILFNNPATGDQGVFRIDHDQAFQQSTHAQYQPFKRGPWYGVTYRYESGLVAGHAPFATASDIAQGYTDLTYLTPDQQAQAQITCGGVVGTLSAPLTRCGIGQLSSPLLSIPKPGAENDDRNPPRIAPRSLFDMGAGWDNVLHKDRLKTNVSITAVNVTDKYALYNFLSTFSGTHFVSPRTVSAQVTFNF